MVGGDGGISGMRRAAKQTCSDLAAHARAVAARPAHTSPWLPECQDAKRLMPDVDIVRTLRTNPDIIMSFQKGRHLIPYDEVPSRSGSPEAL